MSERWENPSVHMGARRFHHLLHSELDAIQKDPSRPSDDRLDAWEEERDRAAASMEEEA